MKAILSDAHGNLEALQAVLVDAEQQGADSIYNLGDTTGYGPNPIECLDLAMKFNCTLSGNWDHATVNLPQDFGLFAEQSVYWTRALLESTSEPIETQESRLEFLTKLPKTCQEGDALFVHGSPRNPLYEYVYPHDISNEKKMAKISENFERICFNGHTHIPGIFLQQKQGWQFVNPEECEGGFRIEDQRIICNVGAVGQPRDSDWRACYVLFDGSTILFRRVEYDVESTIRKIYAVPELDNFLGDRLRDGR